jgi:hypothetical protein
MEFFGKHRLVPHPEMQPLSVRSVEVEASRVGGGVMLKYVVEPADDLILRDFQAERRDNLWRGTCFELFVRPPSGGYVEFNFAPLFAWNAYSFADWRMGRRAFQLEEAPRMADSRIDGRKESFPGRHALDVILGPEIARLSPATASIAAVIEEEGGTMSYWALAHPPGPPNFHHPDCFVASLP